MTAAADARPDPEALLRRIKAEEQRGKATKLKIFFGFAPGVGKTYAMLESARALKKKGIDVVVGAVETHGRSDTAALVEGLEVLPRKKLPYRGKELEEFDLDAALLRKPAVLLLDELAHTNVSGSRHDKRWQDALEVLDAGIEVHTTLNVQHVESLNDVVAQITHVQVRETVPDAVIDRANEIELVDIPPEELLQRLQAGKVYLPEQAARATDHFFKRGNLLALRELALRRTAERVDADVLAYRQEHGVEATWPAGERLLVCISPAPASARLVRAARRVAAGLRAPWVAAYVEPSVSAQFSDADRSRLESHLRLAESLGGTVARLTGARVSQAIIDYARRHNVTRILIGKPTHPRLRDLIRGSVLDEIVRGSGDIDINVISGDAEARKPSEPLVPEKRPPPPLVEYGLAALLVALATGICWLGRALLALPDLAMIYLFVIILAATALRRAPSVLAAGLSVVAYDFFFIPPLLTLAVSDARHLLTFVTMFAIGLIVSSLMARIRSHERLARDRESRTAALFALSRELGPALSENEVATILAKHAADVFEGGAAVFFDKVSEAPSANVGGVPFATPELGVVRWTIEHARPAGRGTDTIPGATVTCFPIRSGSHVFGAIALAPRSAESLDRGARSLVEAFADSAALVVARARLADEAKRAALRARDEEMRNTLLSAVSHDLRTPLGTITGSATTLRDDGPRLSPSQRDELLEAICEEAERLERLVGNLLDMTRLQSGGLKVKREWVPIEEPIGSALGRLERKLEGRKVVVMIGPDLPLLSIDPLLIEQVMMNLVENALKYTPPGSPIDICTVLGDGYVEISVADRGPGISPGSEASIFEKFYRGAHPEVGGVGLGLPVCKGIVEAHGGSIRVANREGGGATFIINLRADPDAPGALSARAPESLE